MSLTNEQRANIRQWVADLRSGKYKQGQQLLHKHNVDGPDEFCCLGVAGYTCQLPSKLNRENVIAYSFNGHWNEGRPDAKWMMDRYGMDEAFTGLLMVLNDGDEPSEIPAMSFNAIAQIIHNWEIQQPTTT